MGITLFDEAVLSDISDLPEDDFPVFDDKKIEASFENYSAPTEIALKSDLSDEAAPIVINGPAKAPPLVQYTMTPLPSGKGKMVTFYLNVVDLSSKLINQFIMLSDAMIQPEDVLFVHLNSIMEIDDSHVVYNALSCCKAKAKIACIPYALNTASFYPALACNFIMPCKFGIVKFDSCAVHAVGMGHIDAKNAYEFDTGRKVQLLNKMHEAGFIPDDALKHILEHQGSYCLYGENLRNKIYEFNKRKK